MTIQPKAILFDLGNTLLHEEQFSLNEGAKCLLECAENGNEFDLQNVEEQVKSLYFEIRKHHRGGVLEFPTQTFLKLACEIVGIKPSIAYDELELHYWQAVACMSPEPDIEMLLQSLDELNIPSGVVSNSMFSSNVLEWELDRHGLRKYFQFVISSADYGIQKPHSAIFQVALQKLNLPAEQVWFVGDNYQKDIVGAHEAGMMPIWYQGRMDFPKKHQELFEKICLQNYQQLIALLE